LFAKRRAGAVVLVGESAELGRVTVQESWTERGPALPPTRFSKSAAGVQLCAPQSATCDRVLRLRVPDGSERR
jgi:hypothetical protein